jgi:predicted SprT family Zn-dependent metalloprotease
MKGKKIRILIVRKRERVMSEIICNACKSEIINSQWWNIAKDYAGEYLCDDCEITLIIKEREGE